MCKACEVALKNFLKENGFNAGERTFNDMGGGDSVREITFTERAAMRTQCRKLTRYIRLADFFVVDAFLALALGSAENFLDYVRPAGLTDDTGVSGMPLTENHRVRPLAPRLMFNPPREHKHQAPPSPRPNDGSGADARQPLFQVEMAFEQNDGIDGELTFLPHSDEFKMHLDAVVYDALKVVTQPARLLTHPDFNLYVQPSIDENGALGEGVGRYWRGEEKRCEEKRCEEKRCEEKRDEEKRGEEKRGEEKRREEKRREERRKEQLANVSSHNTHTRALL